MSDNRLARARRTCHDARVDKLPIKNRIDEPSPPGSIRLRLPYRPPLATRALFGFLAARAVPGIEESNGDSYRRTLALPHGLGVAELQSHDDHIGCTLQLGDMRDLADAEQRCRRLLDLDADPTGVDAALAIDPLLRPLVVRAPGLRVPGTVDGAELALRAVIGQQISVAGARTIAARLVAAVGKPLTVPDGELTHVFPEAEVIADADLSTIGMPGARQRALKALATALAEGDIVVDPGADRDETRAKLLELPGIGPWTASYIAMRTLGDPDAFMPTDLGVRRALKQLGVTDDPEEIANRWKPWRAYAQQHLWTSLLRALR